jgi:hypothetical protein
MVHGKKKSSKEHFTFHDPRLKVVIVADWFAYQKIYMFHQRQTMVIGLYSCVVNLVVLDNLVEK